MGDNAGHTIHRSRASNQSLRHRSINFINLSNEAASSTGTVAVMVPTAADQQPPFVQSPPKSSPPHITVTSQSLGDQSQPCRNNLRNLPKSAPGGTFVEPPHLISVQSDLDSEEEVILFNGRRSQRSMIKSCSKTMKETVSVSLCTEPSSIHSNEVADSRASGKLSESSGFASYLMVGPEQSDLVKAPFSNEDQSPHHSLSSGGYEAAIMDYAENAESNGLLMEHSAQIPARRLALIDLNEDSTTVPLPGLMARSTTLQWDEDDFVDFHSLNTSDNETEIVARVLLKREWKSVTQYLVVWEGKSIDDASWIPLSQLTDSRAQEAILSYEQAAAAGATASEQSSTEASTDIKQLAVEDVARDLQDIIDREERLNGAVDRMTDDHIARLLSKQEELGLGSNELMLFDNLDFEMVSNTKTSKMVRNGRRSSVMLHKHSTVLESQGLAGGAQNMTVADQYGDFDIMDFGRPSLQRKSKGRNGTAPQVSDEELNKTIQKSWSNDRAKKKLRKNARGEARSKGLSSTNGKADGPNNSSGVITASQLKTELRSFLLSNHQR